MNGKHGFAGAVLLVFCAGPLVQAQAPLAPPTFTSSTPSAPPTFTSSTPSAPLVDTSIIQKPLILGPVNPAAGSMTAIPTADTPALNALQGGDPWVYSLPPGPPTVAGPFSGSCGCGATGGGPIGTDVYMRTGPSIIASDTAFGKTLHTGYEVMFGGRSLFFNPTADKAWVIDLGLNYTYNDGHGGTVFNYGGTPVTIRGLDRTAVGLGLGRDWYLLGSGNTGSTGTNLCFGTDMGARWGTSTLQMNINNTDNGYLRHSGIYASAFAGAHIDLIVPMGGWTFLTGLRTEWSYDDLNLLQGGQGVVGTQTGLHSINILWTMGVRF